MAKKKKPIVRIRIDKTVDNCEECPYFERVGDCDDPFCRHAEGPSEMDAIWTGSKLVFIKLGKEIHPECPELKKKPRRKRCRRRSR